MNTDQEGAARRGSGVGQCGEITITSDGGHDPTLGTFTRPGLLVPLLGPPGHVPGSVTQ